MLSLGRISSMPLEFCKGWPPLAVPFDCLFDVWSGSADLELLCWSVRTACLEDSSPLLSCMTMFPFSTSTCSCFILSLSSLFSLVWVLLAQAQHKSASERVRTAPAVAGMRTVTNSAVFVERESVLPSVQPPSSKLKPG